MIILGVQLRSVCEPEQFAQQAQAYAELTQSDIRQQALFLTLSYSSPSAASF